MSATLSYGVGVDGRLGAEAVAGLADLAEARGYRSFWFNLMGRSVDPVATLAGAARRTSTIELGIGVIPLDDFPAADLAPRLKAAGLDGGRFNFGLGVGQIKAGTLEAMAAAIAIFRTALPSCRVTVGAYGPKMLALAGRLADGVLVNWLTPERLAWAREQVAAGAAEAGRPLPAFHLYHRSARGADAADRIAAEMVAYRQWPVHQRHQAAMGNPDLVGLAVERREDIPARLAPYAGMAEPVLKLLPINQKDPAEWQSLVEFFAPAGS